MKFKRSLRANKRGITPMIIALVVTLAAIAVIIPVGLILTSQLASVANTFNLGTSGNSTRTNLFNNIYSAFNLSVVVPIIAAAGLIIAIIVGAFAVFGGKK
jgi:hypothetical protein